MKGEKKMKKKMVKEIKPVKENRLAMELMEMKKEVKLKQTAIIQLVELL